MKRARCIKTVSHQWLKNAPRRCELPIDLHCILDNVPTRAGNSRDAAGQRASFSDTVRAFSVNETMYHILVLALYDMSWDQVQWVRTQIRKAYRKIQPGTAVGTIAANSVASVLLQATLDTFHRTGIRGADTSNAVKSIRNVLHNSKKSTPLYTVSYKPIVNAPQAVRDALRDAKVVNRGVLEATVPTHLWKQTQVAFDTETQPRDGGASVAVRFLTSDRDPLDQFSTVTVEELCQSIAFVSFERVAAEPWAKRFAAAFPQTWRDFCAFNGPCLRLVLCEHDPKAVVQALAPLAQAGDYKYTHSHFTYDDVPVLVVRGRVRELDAIPQGAQVFYDVDQWCAAAGEGDGSDLVVPFYAGPDVANVLKLVVWGFDGAETTAIKDSKLYIYGHCNYDDIVRKAVTCPMVDHNSLACDKPQIVLQHLGVEAARQIIVNRMLEILGDNVHHKNIQLIADCMTHHGTIRALNRHDFLKHNHSLFAKATFEEAVRSLSNAALWGVEEPVNGASQRIALGQLVRVGTNYSSMCLDTDALQHAHDPPPVDYQRWGGAPDHGWDENVYATYPVEAPVIMYDAFNKNVNLTEIQDTIDVPAQILSTHNTTKPSLHDLNESEYGSDSDG